MLNVSLVTKEARTAAFRTMIWTPLKEALPTAGRLVLVKMEDDNIEGGRWDGARSKWSHAALSNWGQPVAWSPLPLLGKTV